jgi:hypothetical protein
MCAPKEPRIDALSSPAEQSKANFETYLDHLSKMLESKAAKANGKKISDDILLFRRGINLASSRMTVRIESSLKEIDSSQMELVFDDLLHLIRLSVICGYHLGGKIDRRLLASVRGKVGGDKSVQSRRAAAMEKWGADALRIARGYIDQHQCDSNSKVASEIIKKSVAADYLPGHEHLEKFVARMRKKGSLPKKMQKSQA